MDTSRTGSYIALKLSEIQKRFEELADDDLAGITLVDGEVVPPDGEQGYDPYCRS